MILRSHRYKTEQSATVLVRRLKDSVARTDVGRWCRWYRLRMMGEEGRARRIGNLVSISTPKQAIREAHVST